MNKIITVFVIFFCSVYPQGKGAGLDYPIDTSFTTYSAYQKEKEKFPFIEIASAQIPSTITCEREITYKTIGNRELKMDLFCPANISETLLPAVLLIHGGGWRSGNKIMDHPMAVTIAEAGYITAAVEYRLSPEAQYPAAVLDLKDAVIWIKNNAAKYHIDSNKIAVLGTSAGGTLAVLTGTPNSILKPEKDDQKYFDNAQVQAIIDIDGILDFTHPAESGKDTIADKPSAGKLWLGASYKDNPEVWIKASPLTHAGKNSPPILFINSSLDRFHAGREQFIEKIKPYNIYYEVKTIPDTPHPFWLFHPWFNQTVSYTLTFLDKIFKDK